MIMKCICAYFLLHVFQWSVIRHIIVLSSVFLVSICMQCVFSVLLLSTYLWMGSLIDKTQLEHVYPFFLSLPLGQSLIHFYLKQLQTRRAPPSCLQPLFTALLSHFLLNILFSCFLWLSKEFYLLSLSRSTLVRVHTHLTQQHTEMPFFYNSSSSLVDSTQ